MKRIYCCLFVFTCVYSTSFAQQRIEPGTMNYLYSPKPNSILYHDTLFKGSNQFRQLFFRQHDPELIRLYKKHQSNKIFGQIFGIAGTLTTIFGIRMVSSSDQNKRTGWGLIGAGFTATVIGGYLTVMGQQNLQMAVMLFNNQQGRKRALGLGIAHNEAGLVYRL